MRTSILLAAVVVFGLTSSAHAQTPSASTVVANVDAFYKGVKQCTTSFSQTVTNATFGKKTTMTGSLRLAPGKMRWDYPAAKKSKGKNIVSDGKTLWIVEHDNLQIIKKSLKKSVLPAAVSFLYGKGGLAKAFTATIVSSNPTSVKLELTPKTATTAYTTLYLVVDATTYAVNESTIVDSAGNTNAFTFSKQDYTTPIKKKWFKVNPYAGKLKSYKIIP